MKKQKSRKNNGNASELKLSVNISNSSEGQPALNPSQQGQAAESGYIASWEKEYRMMRDEIVTYMEKLQSLRDITYGVVGAALVAALAADIHFVFILIPVCFILPSYMCAVNYWTCVRKASAYLVVFHESYEDCPYHWESRHNMFKKIGKNSGENYKKSVMAGIGAQLSPYFLSLGAVIGCYLFKLYLSAMEVVALTKETLASSNGTTFPMNSAVKNIDLLTEVRIDGASVSFYLILLLFVVIVSAVFLWFFSRTTSYEEFLTVFLMIKAKEEQTAIGKCWLQDSNVGDKNGELYRKEQEYIRKRL